MVEADRRVSYFPEYFIPNPDAVRDLVFLCATPYTPQEINIFRQIVDSDVGATCIMACLNF